MKKLYLLGVLILASFGCMSAGWHEDLLRMRDDLAKATNLVEANLALTGGESGKYSVTETLGIITKLALTDKDVVPQETKDLAREVLDKYNEFSP